MNLTNPWTDYTFVAFDTETSGKYPLSAEVCEIAGVKWSKGKIVDTFQSFCKTRLPMNQRVIDIHKITNEMLVGASELHQVLPQFYEFIGDSITIAHHAPFDLGFLAFEFEQLKMSLPLGPTICSCLLAQGILPKPHVINHRLATLVAHFGINQGQAHRALDDSKACLEVALRCFLKVDERLALTQPSSIADLQKIFEVQGGPLHWSGFSLKQLENQEPLASIIKASRE